MFMSADWLVKSIVNLPLGEQRIIALDKLRQQRTVNKVHEAQLAHLKKQTSSDQKALESPTPAMEAEHADLAMLLKEI